MPSTSSTTRQVIAYCWSDGLIKITRRSCIPDGALQICRGPERRVRQAIQATARHGYDGKSLIISGVRDIHIGFAKGDKVEALKAYREQVTKRLSR